MDKAWVGVDLDGTLAKYDGWQGPEHIGEPIESVVRYVKELLDAGVEVKIFTARTCTARWVANQDEVEMVEAKIRQWCYKHLGKRLEITAEKDFDMVFCLDDRAVSVETNTGKLYVDPPTIADVNWHNDPNNPDNPDKEANDDDFRH